MSCADSTRIFGTPTVNPNPITHERVRFVVAGCGKHKTKADLPRIRQLAMIRVTA